MGAILAAAFVAAAGDIARFRSPAALAAAAGLAPVPRQSGRAHALRHPRRGDKNLTRILRQSAFRAFADHPGRRACYDRERRGGKHRAQAAIALARRRTNVLWAMLTRDRPYDPTIAPLDSRITRPRSARPRVPAAMELAAGERDKGKIRWRLGGELERWLAPFLGRLRRGAQRRWAPFCLKGLLLPGERKSVEPPAARVAPADTQQLHRFPSTSPWATAPLADGLVKVADRLVGGPDAVLVVDDTCLVERGRRSVGVKRRYRGQLGRRADRRPLAGLPARVPKGP